MNITNLLKLLEYIDNLYELYYNNILVTNTHFPNEFEMV